MKKSVLILAATFAAGASFAQDLTSKKGEKILPEANDWAIGLNAHPIISTIGSIMNPGAPGSIVSPFGASTITGKMFKDDKTAYRAMVALDFGSSSSGTITNPLGPAPGSGVEEKRSNSGITLGAGLEKRRGSTRLQGYYGGMASLSYNGGTSYEYSYASPASPTGNVKSIKGGSTFGLGVNGFLGAEYFFLPKMSIGAEYWWGLNFSSTGEGTISTDGAPDLKTAKSSSFNLGGQYGSGQLFVNFHF
jgi:hypothetical protein